MSHAFRPRRRLAHLFACIVLFLTSVPAMAQSLPVTPPDQLALQFSEGNSYYFDPEVPVQEIYNVQGGVPNPAITTMSEATKQSFMDAGIIDQFLRTAPFQPDFENSQYGRSDVVLHVRVLTFSSDQQAADYVNTAYANKAAELRDSQATVSPTDLTEVPWNDEAVSGYSIPTVATDSDTGLNVEYLTINYAGQQGSIVIMSRVVAPPELSEPIAREMFYAQMACVQVDAPCGSFMVPVGEFPQTAAIESQHNGGSSSTSVGESGIPAPDASSGTSSASSTTSTSGNLNEHDYRIESSGNWLVLPQATVLNNVTEAIPLQGTNDNFIVASVMNLEGADRVATILSFLAPEIGTPILIEDGGTYMLHTMEIDGVTYGIFSTIEIASQALDAYVLIYIAPLSTFGTGMADLQSSVTIDGLPVLPSVDGSALIPAFGGTIGDPAVDAILPPLIGG